MKTISVTLYESKETGRDKFNAPIIEEQAVEVPGVLVAPSSATDVIDTERLYGKTAVYTIAVPKGDDHDWIDKKIEFCGQTWRSFGIPLEGIDGNIPLKWNKKVMVERYE